MTLRHRTAWATTITAIAASMLGGCAGDAGRTARIDHPLLRPGVAGAIDTAERIDPAQVRADIDRLASFGTRHTLSDTESDTRGIGAARRWVRDEFVRRTHVAWRDRDAALAPRVRFDSHTLQPDGGRIFREVELVNVVCEIPGTDPACRERLYYALGHLDSRNSDANDAEGEAPGANDDASGVAVLLALAEAVAHEGLESTVVLVATSGEEQGLLGARAMARDLRARDADVRAVLSNDIVGDPGGPDGSDASGFVRVFSQGIEARWFTPDERLSGEVRLRELRKVRSLGTESDSDSRQLARFIHEVAFREGTRVQPALVFRQDRFLRGGDHTAFDEVGYPSVRFTQLTENFDREHQDVRTENGREYGDTPEHVDAGYLAGVAALNATVLAHLANAPSGPGNARMIVAELTNDTTLRWEASPEADVAGYEVVYRWTTHPQWSDVIDVGMRTEATVDLSKDNWIFGIRAYDRDGYRSPVVMPAVARE